MAPPFGEKGLKVDEAREFVSLLQSPPIGMDIGVVLAGPMDLALPKSADVLLKSIEEFAAEFVRPILWANDLGGVRPTIRSRCLDVWSPATGFEQSDEELEQVAHDLVNAARAGHYWMVPPLVKKMGPKKVGGVKIPSRYPELVCEAAEALSSNLDERGLALWEQVRAVARWQNPTAIEIIVAFLPPAT